MERRPSWQRRPVSLPYAEERMPWRAEDEVLLQRLEDEALVFALFALYTAGAPPPARPAAAADPPLHPRAGGLVAAVRRLPGGAGATHAALDGNVAALAVFIDGLVLRDTPPELLHHLGLFH